MNIWHRYLVYSCQLEEIAPDLWGLNDSKVRCSFSEVFAVWKWITNDDDDDYYFRFGGLNTLRPSWGYEIVLS